MFGERTVPVAAEVESSVLVSSVVSVLSVAVASAAVVLAVASSVSVGLASCLSLTLGRTSRRRVVGGCAISSGRVICRRNSVSWKPFLDRGRTAPADESVESVPSTSDEVSSPVSVVVPSIAVVSSAGEI